MTVGKTQKKISKKGAKKKVGDFMLKKEWYDVKPPTYFSKVGYALLSFASFVFRCFLPPNKLILLIFVNIRFQREIGKTLVNRSVGTKIASEGLKGRVFEVSLADLDKESDEKSFRKMRLISEDVQGRNVLLNFHGMTFTTDKLRSLVKKWHSLIEAVVDVKTSDGYTLRLFVLAFTKKAQHSIKKTAYAQTAQVCARSLVVLHVVSHVVFHVYVSCFVYPCGGVPV